MALGAGLSLSGSTSATEAMALSGMILLAWGAVEMVCAALKDSKKAQPEPRL